MTNTQENKWYVGAQNDALYIINSKPHPSNDDVVHDITDGPTMAICVHGLDVSVAQAICDAHNQNEIA